MSELYELPDGWEWTKLKNVCNLLNGYAFKATDYVEKSDTVLIRMGNIRPNGSFDADHKIQYLPNKFVNELPNFILKEGDLIIAMTDLATEMRILGNPTLVTNLNSRTFMLNQRVGKLCDFDFSKVTIEYLRYIITAPQIKEYYKSLGGGGLQINIGKQQILSVDFPLPPLPEQQKIVSKLDLFFEKIDKSIALHQKNMDEANAFMGSVLNDVFGELEEKYGLNTFDSVIENKIQNGLYKHKDYYTDDAIKILRIDNFYNGVINTFGIKRLLLDNDELNKYSLNKNDIVVNRVNSMEYLGKCAYVDNLDEPMVFESNMMRITVNKNTNSLYIVKILQSSNIKEQISKKAKKAVNQCSINQTDVNSFLLPLPPIYIQEKVVKYLNEIYEKIEKIKQLQKEKMVSLKALKASILDSAFRGEL